jgi:hypothetical protein
LSLDIKNNNNKMSTPSTRSPSDVYPYLKGSRAPDVLSAQRMQAQTVTTSIARVGSLCVGSNSPELISAVGPSDVSLIEAVTLCETTTAGAPITVTIPSGGGGSVSAGFVKTIVHTGGASSVTVSVPAQALSVVLAADETVSFIWENNAWFQTNGGAGGGGGGGVLTGDPYVLTLNRAPDLSVVGIVSANVSVLAGANFHFQLQDSSASDGASLIMEAGTAAPAGDTFSGGSLLLSAGPSGDGNGGSIVLTSGENQNGGVGSTGHGGPISIITGDSQGSGNSGDLTLQCGTANGTGSGGSILVTAGASPNGGSSGGIQLYCGLSSTGNGGSFIVQSGTSAVLGNGGDVAISAGNATTGDAGDFYINAGNASTGAGGSINILAGQSGLGGGAAGDVTVNAGNTYDTTTAGAVLITGGNAAGNATGGRVTISGGATSTVAGQQAGNVVVVGGPGLHGPSAGGDVELYGGNNISAALRSGRVVMVPSINAPLNVAPYVSRSFGAIGIDASLAHSAAPAHFTAYQTTNVSLANPNEGIVGPFYGGISGAKPPVPGAVGADGTSSDMAGEIICFGTTTLPFPGNSTVTVQFQVPYPIMPIITLTPRYLSTFGGGPATYNQQNPIGSINIINNLAGASDPSFPIIVQADTSSFTVNCVQLTGGAWLASTKDTLFDYQVICPSF